MVEVNPVTNIYQFILAAAGDRSELNTLFYLLRRNPVVLEGVNDLCVRKGKDA